ncbi:hypothetical protein B0J17DRAFT_656047 [Rhizoctonia solani]|nr:hypothetical protein B0J17DRAFT_656047 [Rhizoctonia solani]
MPGYPSHDATGSYSLYHGSSRASTNSDYDDEDSALDSGRSSPQALSIQGQGNSRGPSDSQRNELHREHPLQDDHGPPYDANSTHQSTETSSEEFDSESDEDDDMSMDAGYPDTQNHSSATSVPSASHHAQYSRPRGFVTEDAQSPNPPYAPDAHAFMSPQSTINPSGANAYAQEGMSMSHSYPKSELTPGTSYYCHRSGATHHLDVYHAGSSSSSSFPPQPHNAPTPRGRGIICPICLDPAQDVTSTLCGHIFCASCIKSALSMREACPVCNRAISQWSTHPIYPVF